ncbi:sulfurtransferase [Nocardia camponoti]|uniref:Sulfurtransferase n=1 Tax=Nocardia camponoti TaxID=1616106 RepID=A0A917QMD1_9NOCA|nr:sulfurtransferase [Nocardia camponoti]GGK56101.1 sulfurtransferase [Nocardia camponoti]
MSAVLVSPEELREELVDTRIHLLDVRWALGDPNGPQHYLDGHLPGAVFVDLETELAAPPSPAQGRHPLPDTTHFQKCARSWGLTATEPVVVYDATGGLAAARAWWLLRWAGVENVRILDGGLPAWIAAGGAIATGEEPAPDPGDLVVHPGALSTIDIDGAATWPGQLLDARAAERYRGEVEPIDPQAGHIPGALSAPTTGNLDENGRFLPAEDLAERFAALGEGPFAVYCGSGVTAAHQVAALAIAGLDAALYPGSWSQWSNDSDRPVEKGA